MLDKPTSTSITASVPKVKEKGVSQINLLGVVWYAHSTLGSSSTHFPLAFFNLFFNSLTMLYLSPLSGHYSAGTLKLSTYS